MNARTARLSLLAVVLLVLTGCPNPMAFVYTGGSLAITIDSAAARSIGPTIDTAVAAFDVDGTGPEGRLFHEESDDGAVSARGLYAGAWHVVVTGRNAEGTAICAGEADAEVVYGGTTELSIVLLPLSGLGGLDLAVVWDASLVSAPSIEASIVPSTGAGWSLVFAVGEGRATYSSALVPAGYYTLEVKLLDGGATVVGAVESARVIAGAVTSKELDFLSAAKPMARIDVSAASFTVAWDAPASGAAVASYNVYTREPATSVWTLVTNVAAVAAPELTITAALLDYGTYVFAVTSVGADGSESDFHASTDDTASPTEGWCIVWTRPS
jgi:hypothetical protein